MTLSNEGKQRLLAMPTKVACLHILSASMMQQSLLPILAVVVQHERPSELTATYSCDSLCLRGSDKHDCSEKVCGTVSTAVPGRSGRATDAT